MQKLVFFKKVIKTLFFVFPFSVIAETVYEPNNTLDDAQSIFTTGLTQFHAFDYAGDEDWLVFYAQKGTQYDIEIDNAGQGINPAIELFNEKGEVEVGLFDFNFTGEGELLSWNSSADGFYYIRVTNLETEFSPNSQYNIKVFLPIAPNNGGISGIVIDQCTQLGLGKIVLKAEGGQIDQVFSAKDGAFGFALNPGEYKVTTKSNGYQEQSKTITIPEEGANVSLDFDILPEIGCATTDPAPDPDPDKLEILKLQAVAVYDDSSRLLTIKDIRVGNDILAVTLEAQDDFSFILETVEYLTNSVSSTPAFYNLDSLSAEIPKVFAYEKLFSVQLRQRTSDGAYIVKSAEPLSK